MRVCPHRFSVLLGLLALTACGGGSSAPTRLPPPAATLTPAPEPTPTPAPSGTPTPCTMGLCEEPTTSTAPVARVILKLFQLFDEENNWILPTPNPIQQVVKEPIPEGYTVKLDCTAKDAEGKDTHGKEDIQYIYSDASMVEESYLSKWTVRLKILKPGPFTVYVLYDGVGSNDLRFTFVEKE